MTSKLYAEIIGCSNISSISVTDSHSASTSTATVQCETTSLDVGNPISIDLGTVSQHSEVFSGYIKNVQRTESPDQYEISCAGAMIRAVDYFIASDNPDSPYKKTNITAEDVISDLMAMAGLTDYVGGTSYFTFATKGEGLEVNLVSSYDYSKFIADLIAWHVYADNSGTVHFLKRDPFPMVGDVSTATMVNSNIISASYWRSDRDLRNRIVVYGSDEIHATAQESSPYLPDGFYKSVAVAAPTVITSQGTAQLSADYNLALLNRLTVGGSLTIIGDPSLTCRSCITVDKDDIGMSGLFYIYGLEHSWSKEGFQTTVDLRQ